MLRHGLHLDRVPEVRLVRAIPADRVAIGDVRELLCDGQAAAEFLEHAAQHRLHSVEHIFLGDEAHLDVELIELAGRTVSTGVLVAEAGGDLEVAVEARHHDQLLELLRRLRKRIELAGMNARRHQEVARALGAGRGQDRRLELEEALVHHAAAQRVDDLATLHDVLVDALAAEIEEAIAQANVFRVFGVAEDRERQFGSLGQHLDAGRENLHKAGRQVAVLGADGAHAHLAVDTDHPFGAHLFGHLEGGRIRIGHHLGHAVMITQVDEQQAAVVTDAVDPAGNPDFLSGVFGAELATGVAAVGVH